MSETTFDAASTGYTRPTRLSTFLELRAPLELLKFPFKAAALAGAPRGDGRPVLLAPGYLSGEEAMAPLAQYLRFLGYRAYPWGLGMNQGDVENDIVRFGERVEDVYSKFGKSQVTLIGWSLGGVAARETARLFEPFVREVITLGTPIVGGPKYTAVGRFYAGNRGIDLDAFEQEVHERNSIGLKQPVTSIFSKSDGIVGWRASVDTYNPQARNIQVAAAHFALGVSPVVWRIVADVLAGCEPSVSSADE